ncbi:MAG: DNA-processing protein DprA [Eubacterium sp.]|nr:DNA-processing protein DprA [Eubacterium sp.]
MYQNFAVLDPKDLQSPIYKMTEEEKGYPSQFSGLPGMPSSFYYIGELPDPALPSVAIVGARACSAYGRREAFRFARVLAGHGVQIISGMAEGIDSWSQRGAIEGGGKTYAVLGTGPNVCYPRSSLDLYQNIIKNGGIFSEFEPDSPPKAWHFPLRNRIISAFANIVLVIEARRKSGSLITADYALNQGKTIYAVPGSNHSALSQGTNHLIAQGAGVATSPEAILLDLGLLSQEEITQYEKCQEEEQERAQEAINYCGSGSDFELPDSVTDKDTYRKVISTLDRKPQCAEEIAAKCGASFADVCRILMQLCISGQVLEEAPGYYCKLDAEHEFLTL